MHNIVSILLAFSASLDSLIIGIAYGIKKIKIGFFINIIIATIVTAGTYLSMKFGALLTLFIPISYCKVFGTVLLIIVGIWMIYDTFNKRKLIDSPKHNGYINSVDYDEIINFNNTADFDGSGSIELKEALTLALSLSLNNFALGLGASISGINIYLVTIFTFIFSVITLLLGLIIGSGFFSKILGEKAPFLSGFIIIFIGIFQILL